MKPAAKPAQLRTDVRDALRASIAERGTEQARALVDAFDRFNRDLFAVRLSKPAVLVTPPASGRAWADHATRDHHGIQSVIRIGPRAMSMGERFALDVLLHEMVHQYVTEVESVDERSYRGHGPRFAAVCNTIGAVLGLPEVFVKPRGKGANRGAVDASRPDCAQWPICVRPEGYYGDADDRVRGKQRKSDEGDEGATDEGNEGDEGDELAQLRAEVAQLRALCREQEAQLVELQTRLDECDDALQLECEAHERTKQGHENIARGWTARNAADCEARNAGHCCSEAQKRATAAKPAKPAAKPAKGAKPAKPAKRRK